MQVFQIGQRVMVTKQYSDFDHERYNVLRGKIGTIVNDSGAREMSGVEFDEPFGGGHDCNGRAKKWTR